LVSAACEWLGCFFHSKHSLNPQHHQTSTESFRLGERETLAVRPDESAHLRETRPTALPLPKGEGWGEGEGRVRCDTTILSFTSSVPKTQVNLVTSIAAVQSSTIPAIRPCKPWTDHPKSPVTGSAWTSSRG
jgi:hypothetical protein